MQIQMFSCNCGIKFMEFEDFSLLNENENPGQYIALILKHGPSVVVVILMLILVHLLLCVCHTALPISHRHERAAVVFDLLHVRQSSLFYCLPSVQLNSLCFNNTIISIKSLVTGMMGFLRARRVICTDGSVFACPRDLLGSFNCFFVIDHVVRWRLRGEEFDSQNMHECAAFRV